LIVHADGGADSAGCDSDHVMGMTEDDSHELCESSEEAQVKIISGMELGQVLELLEQVDHIFGRLSFASFENFFSVRFD